MNRILCCIPARYHSSRLPGKPLLKINNKTLINLVYEKALLTKSHEIIVLTDDIRIYNEVKSFGGQCEIIKDECLNGTDRIIKYLKNIDHSNYEIIVNIQGDEPFINPTIVDRTIDNMMNKLQNLNTYTSPVCSTICYKTKNIEEIMSKSTGKVVLDKLNNIMYCSRNVIPSGKNNTILDNYYYLINVGIFVFKKIYLLHNYNLENTKNQLNEDIEWLKIIEQGFKINTIIADSVERGVDTKEDYKYLCDKYSI